ncbi:MAG: hypothetical protein Q4B60_01105 [Erysipelotrichaceae bacterium]|nr:hypothetical protein [Erysipelotrichaceae bacterium]
MNKLFNKTFSILISILIAFECIGFNSNPVFADTPDISCANVTYGQTFSPQLNVEDVDSIDDWLYTQKVDADTIWKTLDSPLPVGKYYIGVFYFDKNGEFKEIANDKYPVEVLPATIASPSEVVFDSSSLTVNWTSPTKTTDNANLDEDAIEKFVVTLIKPDNVKEYFDALSNETSYTFGLDKFNKEGEYKVSVQAINGNDSYKPSGATESNAIYASKVNISSLTGVNSFSINDLSTSQIVLIAGNSSSKATVKVNKSVGYPGDVIWSNNTDLTVNKVDSDDTEATYTINVNGSYTDPLLNVTISGTDNQKPSITDYAVVGTNNQTLEATATDEGSGVKEYLFTTSTSVDGTESGWQVSNAFKPTSEGTYYVYVKDNKGNIASSADATLTNISYGVKAITYHNYNGTQTTVDYRIGEGTYNVLGTSRTGYLFDGWYTNSALTGETVSSTESLDLDVVELWAKWTPLNANITNTSGYGTTDSPEVYDGETHDISVTLNNPGGTFEYQWMKLESGTYVDIPGAINSTYAVRNVSDSGKYKVKITYSIEGLDPALITSDEIEVNISPAPLIVVVDRKDINYLDTAPSYTFCL